MQFHVRRGIGDLFALTRAITLSFCETASNLQVALILLGVRFLSDSFQPECACYACRKIMLRPTHKSSCHMVVYCIPLPVNMSRATG